MSAPGPDAAAVHAAGGVVWRPAAGGGVEVAVVHRPRYDDWSLPKGKRDAGEPMAAAAVREMAEETGQRVVLGPQLGRSDYQVADGPKTVRYWAARALGGDFAPGEEVDELRWVPPEEAARLLSYAHEQAVLERFTALPATRTLLLVRHAKAGKRSDWHSDDDLRPLTDAGWRQAAALRVLLPLFGPDQVHSAPPSRCVQTVQALADDLGVPVQEEPLLSEKAYWSDRGAGLARLREIAEGTETAAVVCSQGDVIPDIVETLTDASGLRPEALASRKGSVWALSFADGTGMQVLAADYHPDPFD